MLISRLCLLLALLLFPWIGGGSGVLPLAVLGLLAAGGWIGWATSASRPELRGLPLRWPFLALVVVAVVTTLTSVYRPASVLGLSQLFIVLSLAALAFCLPLEREQVLIGLSLFAADFLASVLQGLVNGWVMHWRVQGTWENSNFYAGFLLLCLPMLAVFARHAAERMWRLVAGFAVVGGVVALLLTESRGGVLAFFIVLLLFAPAWLWAEGKLSRRGLGLLAVGFVVLVGLALLSPVGKRVLDPQVRAKQLHSQMFRYYTWRGALRMIRAYPWLGSGPKTFPSVYGQYQVAGYTDHAHQIYLEAAAETGVVGLLALLWLLLAVLLLGVHALRMNRSRELPAAERTMLTSLVMAQCASTLGLLLHGLVDSDWAYPGIQLTVLLQAALVWQLLTPEAPVSPAPRWLRVPLPAALSLIAVLLLPGAWAEQLVNQARDLIAQLPTQQTQEEQQQTWHQVGDLYRQALRLSPSNTHYMRQAWTFVTPQEAEDNFRLAMRLEPTNADNWLNYGHLALNTHPARDAAEAYATAELKEPNSLPTLYGLAKASWLANDLPRARAAVQRILATIGTPMDLYHPLDVPETWYLRAWYAEGIFARQAGEAAAAQQAFTHTVTAAAEYQQGFSVEAQAMAVYSGNTHERAEVDAIASLAHEQLAIMLAAHDPRAAEQQRAAELPNFHLPAAMLTLPFPELLGVKKG